MSTTTGVARTGAPAAERAWRSYLETLEVGLHALDRSLVEDGTAPVVPDWTTELAPPDVPVPPVLADRVRLISALLADVSRRAEARRKALLGDLGEMSRHVRQARHDRTTSTATRWTAAVGGRLDVSS